MTQMTGATQLILVNGEPSETNADTLAALITERGLQSLKVATAINGVFVPEMQRAERKLAPGDRVEILSARQGG